MSLQSLLLQAVIFDFDGVLVDTEPIHYQAFQEVLRPFHLGYSYERYLEHYIGFDDRDAFREVFHESGCELTGEKLNSLIRLKAEEFKRIVSKSVESFPGANALISELQFCNVPMAIASGALKSEIEMILRFLGIGKAFPVIVAADDVNRSKPDPETYMLALEKIKTQMLKKDLDPGLCVSIEDTPSGIESAKAAGLVVVGVPHSQAPERLKKADHVVGSLSKLNVSLLNELVRR